MGNAEDMKMRYGIDPEKMTGGKPAPAKPDAANGDAAKPPLDLNELSKRDALRVIGEMQQAKLIRAAVSERQLQEVLVDFWSNHFNVDVKKGPVHVFKPQMDREAIRPHVLGKFRDMLGASAHSPAMLAYLDNNENSVAKEVPAWQRGIAEWYIGKQLGLDIKGSLPAKIGPNENYARELLELHTLGVDGGYTQKDVQEVARCFSGWSFSPFNASFNFDKDRHDQGEKLVLGKVIPAKGGAKDGELVLDLIAKHPSTAKYISRKLCQRFVSDDPPAALVERAAKMFTLSEGDLRLVVRTIVTSEEFFSATAYRSKVKSPFEYAVSAMRATSGEFQTNPFPMFRKLKAIQEGVGTLGYDAQKLSNEKKKSLNWHVYDMGQPLLACAPPTGYPEVSSKWVSPGALIDRLNFAIALTEQNVADVKMKPDALVKGVDADQASAVLDRLSATLLHGEMSEATRKTIEKSALPESGSGRTVKVDKVVALILGSPEFQRR